jgi:pimeloyl-ACP methyl ester carboxylesterase
MNQNTFKNHSNKSIFQKLVKIMMIVFGALLVSLFMILVYLQYLSPGTPEPFRNTNGTITDNSISEKIFIEVNGVKQGMFIKSKDASNPVLLYLHGGMPDYFLTQKYPTGLDDYFTVVWWEQRGSGLSYSPGIPANLMNVKQFISDTLAITNYLRDRFDKDKIYLMGHSGGTFIGIQAVAQAPQLYEAYIGVAQMSYQLESEKQAYDFMLQTFRNNGNRKMVGKLESAPVTLKGGIPQAYNALRDIAMHSLGIGTMHNMKSVITGIFFPSLAFREYTLKEKLNLWRGKSQTGISSMWNEMIVTDLSKQVNEIKIPVYFFGGTYDYTVSTNLAKDYFEKIQAPIKGFYVFEQSAHSPMYEEPEKMKQIMLIDVIPKTNSLADLK